MGVYIKGMEMPDNCAECCCLRHDCMDGVYMYQCNVTLGIRHDISKRPKWCPLVELPEEHEDLIERPSDDLVRKCDKSLLREYFRKIPAFIEAERKERTYDPA